ncbi:MAG: zinc dependent phospholipase C family protein [Saprospiraceae bacterium]
MKKICLTIILFASQELFAVNFTGNKTSNFWGFYAHKLLNRLAIFTLPDKIIEFYKNNVDYIQEHAVDPDKRRYAIKGEAIRHYIDLDEWGENAVDLLPRKYEEAIARTAKFYNINGKDSCLIFDTLTSFDLSITELHFTSEFKTKYTVFKEGLTIADVGKWLYESAMSSFDEKEWIVDESKTLQLSPEIFNAGSKIYIQDKFSKHGIIPYSLPKFYQRLVSAFKQQNSEKILKLSSEIGHYIADSHVPLHTTKNYNGQLSNQDGIHAFWESRIPELFAESEFDFVVGNAEYVDNIEHLVWKTLKHAHSFVDSVLLIEKRISQQVPSDHQYCYENRLGIVTKLPCKDYAALYNNQLDYQIEEQFRSCILTIGSVWMSAWTDAGQPDISKLSLEKNTGDFHLIDSIDVSKSNFEIRQHE